MGCTVLSRSGSTTYIYTTLNIYYACDCECTVLKVNSQVKQQILKEMTTQILAFH